jgi:catechol 2,3-dioxygenase-like lactoylglutathione lyase family enzyme
MKNRLLLLLAATTAFSFGFYLQPNQPIHLNQPTPMKLGAFSISLSVKDIQASKKFYETLGFTAMGGDLKKNYLIMKNGNALVGLFQGMFEGNILTFNPGWDENAGPVDPFDDVRKIQQHVKQHGLRLTSEADETTNGPASITLSDPDGNIVLIDQHR